MDALQKISITYLSMTFLRLHLISTLKYVTLFTGAVSAVPFFINTLLFYADTSPKANQAAVNDSSQAHRLLCIVVLIHFTDAKLRISISTKYAPYGLTSIWTNIDWDHWPILLTWFNFNPSMDK